MAWLNLYIFNEINLVEAFISHLIVRLVVIMMFFMVVMFLFWWICWFWSMVSWLWNMVSWLRMVVSWLWDMIGRLWVVWVMLFLWWVGMSMMMLFFLCCVNRPIKIGGKTERIILSSCFWDIVILITTWRNTKARESTYGDNMLIRIFLVVVIVMVIVVVSMMIVLWWIAWLRVVIYWLRFWVIYWFRFWMVYRLRFWMVGWCWLMVAWSWWMIAWSWWVISSMMGGLIKECLLLREVVKNIWLKLSSFSCNQNCCGENLSSHL